MRMKALVKAQWLEVRRNPSLLMLPIVVLFLTLIYSLMAGDGPSGFFVSASLLMTAYMVGFQIPTLSIAEDKEKRTLEAVLLTPATPVEVIGAKAIVGALISTGTGVIALLIYKVTPADPLLLVVTFGLALLLAVSLGVLIGLVAKDQKSAGVMAAPVMIVLLLFTVMPWPEFAPQIWAAMRWLPTRPVMELMLQATTGIEGDTPVWQSILVMLPYVALAAFVSVRQVRRQASAR